MTTIYAPESTLPSTAPARRNRWLFGLSVILLVLGLGVGFLVGRATTPETPLPSDLAGTEVTQVLDDYVQAFNDGDATKLESLLATDSTFTDTTQSGGYTGTKIAKYLASLGSDGFQISEPGTALQNPPGVAVQGGDYVVRYNKSPGGSSMAVYLVANGKIRHIWIVWP
jgi:hypothetical protein